MKERELRQRATCAGCDRKLGEIGSPLFYVVEITPHLLDGGAIQRQTGLGIMLGGRGDIARVMGPDEDMATALPGSTVTVCQKCAVGDVCLLVLAESATKERDR